MDVLVINGTPRSEGQTRVAWQMVTATLRAKYPDLDVVAYDLAKEKLPLFGYELTADEQLAVDKFIALVRQARAVLFCTPEYHHSLSGALKNAVDHLDVPDTVDKVAAIVTVGGRYGGINGADAVRAVCHGLRMWCAPVACCIPLEQKSAVKALENPLNQKRLAETFRQMVQTMNAFPPATNGQ